MIFEFNSLLCLPEMTHLYNFFPLCQIWTLFDGSECLHVSLVFGQFVDNLSAVIHKSFSFRWKFSALKWKYHNLKYDHIEVISMQDECRVNILIIRFCVKYLSYSENRIMCNIKLVFLISCFQPHYAKSKFQLTK